MIRRHFLSTKIKSKPDFIDLGLPSGTLWSDKNLTAQNIYDFGNDQAFFGSPVLGKDIYVIATIDPNTGNEIYEYKKYNNDDNLTVVQPEDDCITQYLGGTAHLPSVTQVNELMENTTYERGVSDSNSVYIKLTSKINGAYLIFPCVYIELGDSTQYVCGILTRNRSDNYQYFQGYDLIEQKWENVPRSHPGCKGVAARAVIGVLCILITLTGFIL